MSHPHVQPPFCMQFGQNIYFDRFVLQKSREQVHIPPWENELNHLDIGIRDQS